MFKPNDRVKIHKSKSGYEGPGEIIDVAYGANYLVRVEDYKVGVIVVRMADMSHDKSTPPTKAKVHKIR